MLPQQQLIADLRQRCQRDPRVVAAMLYGSWALAWGSELLHTLCARHDLPFPSELLARIRAQDGVPIP